MIFQSFFRPRRRELFGLRQSLPRSAGSGHGRECFRKVSALPVSASRPARLRPRSSFPAKPPGGFLLARGLAGNLHHLPFLIRKPAALHIFHPRRLPAASPAKARTVPRYPAQTPGRSAFHLFSALRAPQRQSFRSRTSSMRPPLRVPGRSPPTPKMQSGSVSRADQWNHAASFSAPRRSGCGTPLPRRYGCGRHTSITFLQNTWPVSSLYIAVGIIVKETSGKCNPRSVEWCGFCHNLRWKILEIME